jgi:hypothetical protein
LTVVEQGDRAAEWVAVRNRATRRAMTDDGARLEFAPDAELAAALADLVVREVECCAFFTFTISVDRDGLVLTIGAPDEAREILAALMG